MGVDFSQKYGDDDEPTGVSTCDRCGEAIDDDHYADMEAHDEKHRQEEREQRGPLQRFIEQQRLTQGADMTDEEREAAWHKQAEIVSEMFSGQGMGAVNPDASIPLWPGEPDSEGRSEGLTEFGSMVVTNLRDAADTFAERARVYRDNYNRVGEVMAGLFPDGAPLLKTAADYNRWHLFELAVVKLTRYAVNYDAGHDDSLSDMIVYLSMVQALDRMADRG